MLKLPGSAWREIVRWGAVITAGCIVVSVIMSGVLLGIQGQKIEGEALVQAVVMPIILGVPVLFYMLLRQQELKLAYARLDVVASTDWLTGTLNRRAFTAGVTGLLEASAGGTLLVIDVDHFKRINDRFGHDVGDMALQRLAAALQANIRASDLVGRLGGEEFAVFLCDADENRARDAAERIRAAVAAIDFAPDGVACPISVSIGGAMSCDPVRFADLFRVADQQLYGAKDGGRNRVELMRMPRPVDPPANCNHPAAIATTATTPAQDSSSVVRPAADEPGYGRILSIG
jgi:diguanylate cyclase (GGDEF)-like protein